MRKVKKALRHLIIAVIWLGIWQILSAVAGLSVLLPSPAETLTEFFKIAATPEFWLSALYSVIRITAGFFLGVILGSITAVASAFSKTVNEFLTPIIQIIKATPVASFIILAIVWIKTNNVPSFISMLMVYPIVWTNVKTGINETDKNLLEMSDAFTVPKSKKFMKIYVPSVKPYFISAVTTSMGLAWKAGIAAEVICNPKLSIGGEIYSSKIYLETPKLFAWTAVVILMSISLERIMLFIMKRGKKND